MVGGVEDEEGEAGSEASSLTCVLPGVSGQHGGHGEEAGVTDPAYPGQSHLSLNLRLQYEQQEGTEDAHRDEGGGQEDD